MSWVKNDPCSSATAKRYYLESYESPRYIVYDGCCGKADGLAEELMNLGVVRAFICATKKEFRVIDYTPDYLWRLEARLEGYEYY